MDLTRRIRMLYMCETPRREKDITPFLRVRPTLYIFDGNLLQLIRGYISQSLMAFGSERTRDLKLGISYKVDTSFVITSFSIGSFTICRVCCVKQWGAGWRAAGGGGSCRRQYCCIPLTLWTINSREF